MENNIPIKIKLETFSSVKDSQINVVEYQKHIPFLVKRNYIISTKNNARCGGYHSHKQLWQFFICHSGSFSIEFKKDQHKFIIELTSPHEGILVPPGWWREYELAPHSSVSVLASEVFDENDYIRAETYAELKECNSIESVPFVALDKENKSLLNELNALFAQEVTNNQLILGHSVNKFEQEFAAYCNTKYAIGCGNGLDALTISLLAFDIGVGDEVLLPANTFIATALAVSRLGATPKFVECNTLTGSLNLTALKSNISSATKAIIAVHLFGVPEDIPSILSIAKQHEIKVIEDAAQAHGAELNSQKIGSLADAAAFSFYPTKNLGALGDGGCITSNDKSFADKARAIANYGSNGKYNYELAGINSRLDSIQAVFLSRKLLELEQWNQKRREHYYIYQAHLGKLNEVTMIAPTIEQLPVWHICPIFLTDNKTRDALQHYLANNHIATNIHYPEPLHLTKPYYDESQSLPIAESNAKTQLSLPMCPFLTPREIEHVCEFIVNYFESGANK